jgi:hypothetical protein
MNCHIYTTHILRLYITKDQTYNLSLQPTVYFVSETPPFFGHTRTVKKGDIPYIPSGRPRTCITAHTLINNNNIHIPKTSIFLSAPE